MILIAGPCVIESWEQLEKIGEELKGIVGRMEEKGEKVEFYFKASFDKANRTSPASYRGPGLKEGVKMLGEMKKKFGFPVLTDIHETWQVEPVAEVVDVLQIPAFLCRQTDLLVEAGRSGRKVNIKKGQFLHPEDIRFSIGKVLKGRGEEWEEVTREKSEKAGIWVTERGSCFGYRNLVVDMRSLVIMGQYAPVIFDATHSVQLPGGAGGKSGGQREFVAPLSRAAAGVGVDGFFFETHYDPDSALSDGPNMVTPRQLEEILRKVMEIGRVVKT
jgi:2-dehydro-3-deoxyphosphooctonate aldolase (KDO 8-P synthase)